MLYLSSVRMCPTKIIPERHPETVLKQMRPQLSQPESDSMSSAGDKHGLTTRILFNCVMLHRHVYRSFMTRLNTVRFNISVASDQCLTSHFIESLLLLLLLFPT